MARIEVIDWLNQRLQSRKGMILPKVATLNTFNNPFSHEQVPFSNPTVTDTMPFTNTGLDVIPTGFRSKVQLEDGREVMGTVTFDVEPGSVGQILFEKGRQIEVNQVITLPGGRTGVATTPIPPGSSGLVIVPVGNTILAGAAVTLPDDTVGVTVEDIPPGESGQVESIVHNETPTNPHVICGVVMLKGDGRRIWVDWTPEALAELLDPALPDTLPVGTMNDVQVNTLLDYSRTVDSAPDWWLVRSLELWRAEGLI